MITRLNILFPTVGGFIYLTWLFKSDLKRVISSCVLILCLRVGSFVVYVLFVGGGREWVHRGIITQNGV